MSSLLRDSHSFVSKEKEIRFLYKSKLLSKPVDFLEESLHSIREKAPPNVSLRLKPKT